MRRRDLGIGALVTLTMASPASLAQTSPRMPTIGFLGASSAVAASHWVAAFEVRLRELGWTSGRNAVIAYRWAEGRSDRYVEIAAEFVRMGVDVIVTWGAPVVAASRATSSIPIVFAVHTDPIVTGLVASLSRPGGNVTGLSFQQTDTIGKRLELLREALPGLRRLAILANSLGPGALAEMRAAQSAAVAIAIEVVPVEIRDVADIAPAIAGLAGRVDALYVATDALVFTHRAAIGALALEARLPTIFGTRDYVDAGGLLSYGPDASDLFRRAAGIVDRILRGTRPSDIPIEQPTKFDLVLNLSAARSIGLSIPGSLRLRADDVVD